MTPVSLRGVGCFSIVRSYQGVLIHQRCLSLPGSNLESVAKLLPRAESASGSFELAADLGMMRQVPSVIWSMRQSCSGAPVKPGTATTGLPGVAASARSVPAMVILKYGEPKYPPALVTAVMLH